MDRRPASLRRRRVVNSGRLLPWTSRVSVFAGRQRGRPPTRWSSRPASRMPCWSSAVRGAAGEGCVGRPSTPMTTTPLRASTEAIRQLPAAAQCSATGRAGARGPMPAYPADPVEPGQRAGGETARGLRGVTRCWARGPRPVRSNHRRSGHAACRSADGSGDGGGLPRAVECGGVGPVGAQVERERALGGGAPVGPGAWRPRSGRRGQSSRAMPPRSSSSRAVADHVKLVVFCPAPVSGL